MSDRQTTTFPLRGLDLSTPSHQVEAGTTRLLENLVPTGTAGDVVWEVPAAADRVLDDTGSPIGNILSLGWQRRTVLGPAADTDADPGQSLERLVALKPDGLYTIDPGQGHKQRQLYSFSSPDVSRRAQFAQVGDSLFVGITSGAGEGTPEHLFEVRGDSVTPVQWPPLPVLQVSDMEASRARSDSAPGGFGPGSVIVRWAWELEDGTIGPAAGPVMEGAYDTFGLRVKVLRQADIPLSWAQRIESLVLVLQTPQRETVSSPQARRPETVQQAIERPPKIAARLQNYEPGEVYELTISTEELLASETYEGTGLRAHGIKAGAVYGFNQRLLAGDTIYDLYRPDLEKQIEWADGVENSGGNDYWLTWEVTVSTQLEDVTVYAEPLPFDSTAITEVETRKSKTDDVFDPNDRYPQGYLTYPDVRADSWRFLVSTDYDGDMEAATWEEASTPGSRRQFSTPAAAQFAYTDAKPGEPYDMTSRGGGTVSPLKHRDFEKNNEESAASFHGPGRKPGSQRTNSVLTQGSEDETIDDERIDTFSFGRLAPRDGTTPQSLTFDWETEASIGPNNDADAACNLTLTVEVLDEGGSVLDSVSKSDSISGSGTSNAQSGQETLNSFTPSEADRLRITHESNVTVSPSDSFGSVAADTRVDKMAVNLSVPALSGSESITQGAEDANPNRLIWSQPNTPLDLDPENVLFAGEVPQNRIMAMEAVGQEVSQGQYGEFPIVLFGRESVRVLQTGTNPFVQGVDVVEADAGLVGRRAYATIQGVVVAALDNGVFQFTPQQQVPALSDPLHDVGGDVLGAFGDDTVVMTYQDHGRGRNEVWVCLGNLAFCYSSIHGNWSVLTRPRRDVAPRREERYTVAGQSPVVGDTLDLLKEEQDTTTAQPVRIQTAVLPLGPQGLLKRVFEVQLRQPVPLDEVELALLATDPDLDNPYVQVGRRTLSEGSQNLGMRLRQGLGPGFIVDARGTATPGRVIESVYLDLEVRDRRLRDHQGHGLPGYETTQKSPLLALVD